MNIATTFIINHKARLVRAAKAALLMLSSACIPAQASTSSLTLWIQATPETQKQRNHYIAAAAAQQRGQAQLYRQHRAKLDGYPLAAYLDYEELNRQLHTFPTAKMDRFLAAHSQSYLGEKLRKKWLYTLASDRRWSDFIKYYNTAVTDTELTCHWLYARTRQGDTSAYTEVPALWTVGRSQPKGCDPLFASWIGQGLLTHTLAWERYNLAIHAGNTGLAQYLASRHLSASQKPIAELYRQVSAQPTLLADMRRFEQRNPHLQDVILYGIRQLSRKDALQALSLWQRYDAQHLFADLPRRETIEFLALRLLDGGHVTAVEELTAAIPDLNSTHLAEAMIRRSLREGNWSKVSTWIARLPAEVQNTSGWRYWKARSMEALNDRGQGLITPTALYTELALERSFYGFLAADRLGYAYAFQDKPVPSTAADLRAITQRPDMQRARELLALNQAGQAQREWFYMGKNLTPAEHMAAAKLAQEWGWHRNGILSMAAAQAWDDLNIRFPVVYREHVQSAADRHRLAPPLLYAIARQESAFAVDAMSPAGALGLMQLMPATAKETAGKAGIRYSNKNELLKPEKNIALGSFYIDQLLTRFNGNRILAAAAYNAGPSRVRQWLSDDQNKLPYDVWIETIPYRETRGYVQNILAYSVIYGYRLGSPQQVITRAEAAQGL